MSESRYFLDLPYSRHHVRPKPDPTSLFAFVPLGGGFGSKPAVGLSVKETPRQNTVTSPTEPYLAICPPCLEQVRVSSPIPIESLSIRPNNVSQTGLFPTEPKSQTEDLRRTTSMDSGRSSLRTLNSAASNRSTNRAKSTSRIPCSAQRKSQKAAVKTEEKKPESKVEQKVIKSVITKESLTITKNPESDKKEGPPVTRKPKVRTVTTTLEPTIIPVEVKTSQPKWRNRNVAALDSSNHEIEELTKVQPPSILSNNRSLHMERMVTVTEWERWLALVEETNCKILQRHRSQGVENASRPGREVASRHTFEQFFNFTFFPIDFTHASSLFSFEWLCVKNVFWPLSSFILINHEMKRPQVQHRQPFHHFENNVWDTSVISAENTEDGESPSSSCDASFSRSSWLFSF